MRELLSFQNMKQAEIDDNDNHHNVDKLSKTPQVMAIHSKPGYIKKNVGESQSVIVDRPTQLFYIWIFICCLFVYVNIQI